MYSIPITQEVISESNDEGTIITFLIGNHFIGLFIGPPITGISDDLDWNLYEQIKSTHHNLADNEQNVVDNKLQEYRHANKPLLFKQ